MTVIELLARLGEKKVELSVNGDDLVVRGKEQVLESHELLEMLRENKKALVEYIKAGSYVDSNGVFKVPPNRIPPACEAITPEMLPLAQLTQADIDSVVAMTPGGAPNVQDIYPMAPLQEGMLFHHLLATEGDVYLSHTLLAFDTRDLLDRVLQALQAVIDRHDILRTAVLWEGLSEPVQVVWRRAPLVVEELSIDPTVDDVAEELLARFDSLRYRLDIRQAPLMRVYIAHDARKNRWIMLHLFHHLAVDHITFDIMLEEIHAHLSDRAERLPAPLPFRNFVARARLGVSREEHEEFFRKMLANVEEPTAPFGLLGAQGDGSDIEEAVIDLEPALEIRLRDRARALGLSVASLCHLAWALVLARVSAPAPGRDDVVFGTVLSGRMQGDKGTGRALGLFINTLPARISIGEDGVERSARRAHELLADLMKREHASLALAQRCSGVAPPMPLFNSLINYRRSAKGAPPSPERTPARIGVEPLKVVERTNYPLTLSVDDGENGFKLTAQVVAGLDPGRVCEYMRTALERLAEALEREPETAVRTIDVLPEAERRLLLEEWNSTEADYPAAGSRRERLIHELFEEQAERSPNAVALVYEGRSLTYSELNMRANRLAHHLRKLGVGPEARVAICLERSLEMVVALLATLKAGAAYVPLDPDYPAERLAYMLEDSEPAVLLTHGEADSALAGRLPPIPKLDLEGDEARWIGQSEQNLGRSAAGSDARRLAYIIYTSGSTGLPKGAMNEHRGTLNRLLWMQEAYGLGPCDAVLQKTPFSFDVSVWEFFWPLLCGARLVMARPGGHKDPGYLARIIREQEVTTLHFVPSMLQVFLGNPEASGCSELSRVICSGEALAASLARRFYERLPETELHNLYGPTEAAIDVTAWNCKDKTTCDGIPIGRPVANTEMYVLDDEWRPAPIRVGGGVYIGGEQVGRGYHRRPEMTAERFLPDPFSGEPGERVYKTGDLGRWLPEGAIEFLGRDDFQVKIRGFRVELGEIEARLLEHADVREAVALAREEGEGEKRLVAYYTGKKVEAEALRAHLATALPDYMAPAAYVHLESLPLTPNGKLDRRALPAPDVRSAEEGDGYLAPRTPVEEIVAGIFEEVLKLGRVGRRENFFELGGHSLLATQVVSRVRNSFGVEIGVRSVFEGRTAEGLASKIEEAMRAGEKAPAPPLVRVQRDGASDNRFPLSFAQQRLWFIDRLNPGSAVYNNPGAVRLEGGVNLDALERVINEIVRRHEVLRTRFEVEAGEPSQVIDPWEPRRLEVEDMTGLNPEERKAETSRIAREEAEAGFDLSQGPLLRIKVLKLEEDDHVVLYTMHHIVSDAWSMEILIKEVGALYQAYSSGGVGEAPPLPELPIQYADFAVWQRAWLQGEALEEKLEYWRRRLAGIEDLALPTDRPRPATRSFRGGGRHFAVEGELTRKLRELSQREGVTLFMAMLAGFDVLMSRYGGQEDVALGTDIANRNRAEIEGLIGFFVNQLVLRVEVRTGESFKELLKQVREVCLEAYAHEDAPFEKLVEELRPERDLSRSPLFQVKLIWQNAPRERLELGAPSLAPNGPGEVQMAGEAQMARFDLLVSVVDMGRDLVAAITYSRDLFDEETIDRLVGHYTNVLREIVDDGDRPISALNLLSGAEREQIVVEWNQTVRPYPNERPIHELFAEQVGRAPERIALVGGGQRVSYLELDRRANQLGRYLRRLGVGPEAVVGVCLERSAEMIVAILGVLKAGGAYLPLDPEFPAERLAFLLEDAGVRVVLAERKLEERLQAFRRQVVLMSEEWEGISGESESSLESRRESEVEAENLAYVIYTSGSTGKPKGVMVRHRSLVNYTLDICRRLGLGEGCEDQGLQFATVSTITADLGNTCIYPSLLSGGCLHVLSYETAVDGLRFGEYLRREAIEALKIVPSHLRALLSSQPNGVKTLPQKYLILGGEALTYELVGRVRERGEGCEVINHYGPTETTIGSLTARVSEEDGEELRSMTAPIGRPIANTLSYVVDRELNVVPIGARGELQIAGDGVARGYLGRPGLTAERFIPNPFGREAGERLYRTGDVVRYLSDGKIEFMGRADNQVKVRGYRVELEEIQAVLEERRGVRQSVVVAREDERGDKRIVGYVVGEGVTAAELKQYVREKLPEYMTPEAILLLEKMPLTANGKLDRRSLPALVDAQQPEGEGPILARDVFEHRLVKIWESVLEARPIGVKDKFFDLGGHSILAAILMAKIQSEFERELPLSILFQEGTIERLASFLKQDASSMSWSCLIELQASGLKTPLFFVHPGGGNVFSYYELANYLGTDRPFYAFQEPGLYKEQSLLTSIEDLAAYYIEAMKAAQPEGPYFIGGWSLGGIIAFEMARQLFAQDQKVGQLLMLDSSAPISMKEYLGEEYEEPEDDDNEHKEDAVLLIELFGGLKISKEELEPLEGDKRIEYVLKRGIGMNLFPPDVDLARARAYLELFRTNARARRKYLPQVYQGAVTLFRPFMRFTLPPSDGSARSERIARLIQDPTKGWGELAAGGVKVVEIPGNHQTMVGKPHVETLALRIRECLDEAETIDG